MQLSLIWLWACQGGAEAPAPTVQAVEPSTTLSTLTVAEGMVAISGDVVALGSKATPAVVGFVPPPLEFQPGDLPPGTPVQPPASQRLPAREVWVDSFQIDRTEVTRSAYADFLADTGHPAPFVDEDWAGEGWNWEEGRIPEGTGDHPVVLVNWYDARAFCRWAEKRLPTEAEWQLAALGPAAGETLYPWGNEWRGEVYNHGQLGDPFFDDSDGYLRTSPVGSFPEGASRNGVQDLFGNAWEWTNDVRVDSWEEMRGERKEGRLANPHTGVLGIYAAVRGSSFYHDLRPNPAGERHGFLLEIRRKTSGFRCAR